MAPDSGNGKTGGYGALSFAAVLLWIFIWEMAALFVNRRLLIPVPTPQSTFLAFLGPSFWKAVSSQGALDLMM